MEFNSSRTTQCYIMLIIFQVGSQEAKYNFIGLDSTSGRLNALDPYHTVYLLCDDGTHGRYIREPLVRGRLESYIKTQTTIEMLGSKGKEIWLLKLNLAHTQKDFYSWE